MPPKEKSLGPIRRGISHLGVELIGGVYDFSFSEQSLENTRAVSEQLATNPNLSLILYFNHISYADAPAMLWFYRKYIDPSLQRRVVLPAAYEHMDRRTDPVIAGAASFGTSLFNVEIAPVVQTFEVQNRSEELALATYIRFVRQLRETLPCDVIISPEGHRTETEGLQPAEMGIVKIARAVSPALVLPVGIIPHQNFLGRYGFNRDFNRGVNLGCAFELNIGQGIVVHRNDLAGQEVQRAQLDIWMNNLAELLPMEMRGVYGAEEP